MTAPAGRIPTTTGCRAPAAASTATNRGDVDGHADGVPDVQGQDAVGEGFGRAPGRQGALAVVRPDRTTLIMVAITCVVIGVGLLAYLHRVGL